MHSYDVWYGLSSRRLGRVRAKNIENAFKAAENRWPYYVKSEFSIKLAPAVLLNRRPVSRKAA